MAAPRSAEVQCAPDAAGEAGLRYVTDATPGIRRRRAGRGFSYLRPDGERLEDQRELERIRALAVPPAWTSVWICPRPDGHVQATGRDARGRKQYRYHARWREVRDEAKYGRLVAFGEALPRIRARTARDLGLDGLPRDRVLAVITRLLDETLVRIGNPEYAEANDSYGLTTLEDRHARIAGDDLELRFRGKAGKEHRVTLQDRRLARLVKRCRDIPGYELFQYRNGDGSHRPVDSQDVNDYLEQAAGAPFTAKDFRTWGGTVLAACALFDAGPFESEPEARRKVTWAVGEVASALGNTVAVCRACYIHPAVIEDYVEGRHLRTGNARLARGRQDRVRGLRLDEQATLELLRAGERRAAAA
jgi:DNA topoisomerase-1